MIIPYRGGGLWVTDAKGQKRIERVNRSLSLLQQHRSWPMFNINIKNLYSHGNQKYENRARLRSREHRRYSGKSREQNLPFMKQPAAAPSCRRRSFLCSYNFNKCIKSWRNKYLIVLKARLLYRKSNSIFGSSRLEISRNLVHLRSSAIPRQES